MIYTKQVQRIWVPLLCKNYENVDFIADANPTIPNLKPVFIMADPDWDNETVMQRYIDGMIYS